jgi:hypothetical protein
MSGNTSVESSILLARLNALSANVPDFADYSVSSNTHHVWVGKVQAIVARADSSQSNDLERAVSGLYSLASTQRESWGKILRILARVTTELELRTTVGSNNRDQAFGPGAVYDFFKALSGVIASATKSLLIVDPYMDNTIFDTYLASAKPGVTARLLIMKQAANVRAAAEAFKQQHHAVIDVRKSINIHDRLVFVDGSECWVLGQSIKDAADEKPTYLAPLSSDVCQLKLDHYEDIWSHAS